jgi:peroxiredoxin
MAIFRIVLISAWIISALLSSAGAAPFVDEPAPSLVAVKLDGARFDLTSLRGKVVIINFWATWCPPCREEMPALDAFFVQFHERGVELLGLSVDRSRDRDSVGKMAKTVHYPVALLADADVNGFGKPAVLPVTYVIDAVGSVRAILSPDKNPVTEDALERIVKPLLPGH